MNVHCFHTPCHTKGHILFYFTAERDLDMPVKSPLDDNEYSIERSDQGYEAKRKARLAEGVKLRAGLPPKTDQLPSHINAKDEKRKNSQA